MINTTSMKDQQKLSNSGDINVKSAETPAERKPNDQTGFYFSSSLKITDPESGEVIVQMRAD